VVLPGGRRSTGCVGLGRGRVLRLARHVSVIGLAYTGAVLRECVFAGGQMDETLIMFMRNSKCQRTYRDF